MGVMAISITALGFSYVSVLTRKMKGTSPAIIIFWFSTFGLLTQGTAIIIRDLTSSDPNHKGILSHSLNAYFITFLACFFNGLGQFLFAMAFQLEKSGKIAVFTNMSIVYGFILDIFIYKSSLSWAEVLGGIIIFSTTFGITMMKIFGKESK